MSTAFQHEHVVVRRGQRSGLALIVAVHSTRLGSAVGGCRMWPYADWQDGVADALRLSEAMSFKCAAAGIDQGGGKSVIALPLGVTLASVQRDAVMRDLGDTVQEFGGRYIVGADVGTSAADMRVVREHTQWAADPDNPAKAEHQATEPTATGVLQAIRTTAAHVLGRQGLSGVSVAVVGLGNVGAPLVRLLADEGARLVVTDIDPDKRAIAAEVGATWGGPETLLADVDIVVPAALGGVISSDVVPRLRCRAIVGPANNQLVDDAVADLLAARGVVWAPDFIVNAGGVIWEVATQLDGCSAEDALVKVQGIGARIGEVLTRAEDTGRTPLAVAREQAQARLGTGDSADAAFGARRHAGLS